MKTMPECLKVTAKTEDGEVMAVQHKDYPIYGGAVSSRINYDARWKNHVKKISCRGV